jgi:hypothetical protein
MGGGGGRATTSKKDMSLGFFQYSFYTIRKELEEDKGLHEGNTAEENNGYVVF